MPRRAPQTLISKAAFARRAGVSKQRIGALCASGGILHEAVVDGKVDPAHACAVDYLSRRAARSDRPDLDETPGFSSDLELYPDDGTPDTLSKVKALTIAEVGRRFGGSAEFIEWLKALKLIEEVRGRRISNEEDEGELISRELVRTHVFSFLEESHQRVLADGVKTLVRRVQANCAAGVSIEKSEEQGRDIIGKLLEHAKQRAQKTLDG